VIGWRLVNFWLPIPVGALSYVSLKVKPGQGKAAFRSAISGMMTMVGPSNQPETAQDTAAPQEDPGQVEPEETSQALPVPQDAVQREEPEQAAEEPRKPRKPGEAKDEPGEAPVTDRQQAEEQ
jgi:hypothetical protein